MKIGIIGGGQLARMLSLSAYTLGFTTLCYDPEPSACAGQVAPIITAAYDDTAALDKFAAAVDCITYEFENISARTIEYLAPLRALNPCLDALRISQDRWLEKNLFTALNIPTVAFFNIESLDDLTHALDKTGYPAVLKTRRLGYDGKGQFALHNLKEAENALRELDGTPVILEEFIKFDNEVSLIAVRNLAGDIRYYPLTLNHHEGGILRTSHAPFTDDSLLQHAMLYMQRIAEKLNYVGVLTLEFFNCNGKLLVNEMAPRVHNSGHWTIEGAVTSQFENHIRAVCNLPLGATDAVGHSVMTNCIGEMPDITQVLSQDGAHYHAYGKERRPGRKVGHITAVSHNYMNLMSLKD